MKATILLVCSLAANAALGYIYWQQTSHANNLAQSRQPGTSAVEQSSRALTAGHRSVSDTGPHAPVIDAPLKAALKSGDPHALLAALRADGFPEKYIRDIMIWKLGDTTKEKRYALQQEAADRPFWRPQSKAESQAWEKALNDLDGKNLGVTKDIFGGFVPPSPQFSLEQRRYGFLPVEKIEIVADANSDYATLLRNAVTSGGADAADKVRQNIAAAASTV